MTLEQIQNMAVAVEKIKAAIIATECRTLEGAAALSKKHGGKHPYDAAYAEARVRFFASQK